MAQDNFTDDAGLFDDLIPDAGSTVAPVIPDDGGVFEGLDVAPTAAVAAPAAVAPPTQDDAGLFDETFQADVEYQGLLAQGDKPEADVPLSGAGFFPSLKSGLAGLYQSAVLTPSKLLNEEMRSFAQENFPGTDFDVWTQEEGARLGAVSTDVKEFQRAQPVSRTIQKLTEADTVGDFVDTFMDSNEKWTVVKEVIGSSAPFSIGMMSGTAYAGLPGTFSSVFMMDWGDSYQESLDAGKSPEDAKMDATVKALTQAGVDTATMGVARLELSANKIKDWLGQMAVQMIGGGGAEALKHELVDEQYTLGQVGLEMAGELAGGPLEILTARASNKAPRGKAEILQELIDKLKDQEAQTDVEGAKVHIRDIISQLEGRETAGAVEDTILTDVGVKEEALFDVDTGPGISQNSEDLLVQEGTVETADGVQSFGTVDWEATPVVVAEETHWKGALEKVNQETIAIQEHIVAMQSGQINMDVGMLQALEERLAENEQLEQTITESREQEQDAVTRAGAIIEDWVQIYAPDMKVVVSTGQFGQRMKNAQIQRVQMMQKLGMFKSSEEFASAMNQARSFDLKDDVSTHTYGHFFKLPSGVAVIEADVFAAENFADTINQAEYMETVAHEFGHALLNHVYAQADLASQLALKNGYKKWLKKLAATKTHEDYYKVRVGAASAKAHGGQGGYQIDPGLREYAYGMNEYLANQMAKAVGTDKLAGTPVAKFFKDALALLKSFFIENKEHMPEQSFQDFLNLLAAKTTLSQLEKAQASQNVESQAVVVEKAYSTIESILSSSQLKPRGPVGRAAKVTGGYGKEEFRGDLDKYNSVLKWGTTLIQMGKLNQHIPGLQKYVGLIKQWWNTKMQQTARADERLQQWNSLKAKDSENLGKFMQELTVRSYDNQERYGSDSDTYKKLAEKYKMSDEMFALADLIEQDFAEVLIELEAVQVADAERTFTDELEKAAAIREIEGTFRELRERNFFPLSRFGEQFMRVKAERDMIYEGEEYKAGETITFETFETQKEMKARQKVFGNRKKYIVEGGLMNDTQKQFAGFPPQFLTMLKKRLDLNEIQQGEFEDLIHDLAPGKSFTKHMKHRKNTKGYSTDAVRSYANYFLHFGNYVARIKYKGVMQDAINEVGESARVIGRKTGDGTKRTRIQQFMQDHYEAAMNPGNELANLRAVGFLWYLGFVPKSAMVNLTQVPLVTYPFLGARYGDVQALAALSKATKDAGKYWLNPRAMTEGQMRMIDELIQTGILDESMATELAAAAEGSVLQRVAPGNLLGSEKAARAVRRMAGAGAWMFQKAEKMNRRITALAAYGLAKDAGQSHDEAVAAARDAVESTQYEYARWNRPRFSQGKKSVMFLFWQYMQNSLFFLAHDPGRMRYVMMMTLFAGLSGLPFAEDAMDLFDYISKKLNKQFGEDFSPSNIRLSAHQFIKELGMNPDLVMHGASRYSFGMSAVGDMLGLPIPNVDVSGSLSMGHIVPGLPELLGDAPFDKGLGRGAEQLGGAVIAMPIQLMRAIADDNPDTLKRFERAMPSFAKHLSKAYRYAARGEETLPDGTVVAKFNIDDSMHKAEIAAQALGFNTTRVAEAKEPFYLTKEIIQYYALRRQSFTELLDYAKNNGDSVMWAKTWGEVRKFNDSLKKRGLLSMGIKPSSVRRNLKNRKKQRLMQERGLVGGRTGAQVSQEVYDAYSEEEVE